MGRDRNLPGLTKEWKTDNVGGGELKGLAPVRSDYATVPIRDGFNWGEVVGVVDGFQAYLVVFRSARREGSSTGSP